MTLSERGEGTWDQGRPCGRESRDAQASCLTRAKCFQSPFRVEKLVGHRSGVFSQHQSSLGGTDPTACLLEQRRLRLPLESRDALAHRRGGVAQRRRGGGDRTSIDHGLEDLQTSSIKHAPNSTPLLTYLEERFACS